MLALLYSWFFNDGGRIFRLEFSKEEELRSHLFIPIRWGMGVSGFLPEISVNLFTVLGLSSWIQIRAVVT